MLGDGARKLIHEARIIRDAEEAEPGIVRRALDEKLAQGKEPVGGVHEARAPLMQPPAAQGKARADPMAEPFGAMGSGDSLGYGHEMSNASPNASRHGDVEFGTDTLIGGLIVHS